MRIQGLIAIVDEAIVIVDVLAAIVVVDDTRMAMITAIACMS